MPVSILLVDDHTITRQGLQALLENEPDFQIIGHAGNGIEALNKLQTIRPDVILLDISMPEMTGIEATRQIRMQYPGIRIVILSMHLNEAYAHQALLAGASAYVVKGADYTEVMVAIRASMQEERYLSHPFTDEMIKEYAAKTQDGRVNPYDTLTNRERQIFHLAVDGFSSTEIGEKLYISRRTVETHRENLMHKLGLHNQSELVRYAILHGIVPLDDELH